MKVLTPFLALLLFLEAGCALGPRHYWYHPDRTLEEAKEDYRQCRQRARQEAGEAAADDHLVDVRSKSRASDDEIFGIDHMESSSSLGAMYRQNALSGCMQSKGYLRVRDYRLPSDVRRKAYATEGVAGW